MSGAKPTKTPKREPKPCPRCYAPMRYGPDGFLCERHGAPEPERAVAVTRTARPKISKPRAPRVRREPRPRGPRKRWGSNIRYPSDEKFYPLPPSPDGRANNETSKDSPTTARSKLTPLIVAQVIEQTAEGLTPWQIAGPLWEELGFSSRHSCKGAIYRCLRAAQVESAK